MLNDIGFTGQKDEALPPIAFSYTEPPPEKDLLPDDEFSSAMGEERFTEERFLNEHEYDVAVIGSGPAGNAAAIRAAKLGAKVIMFEKESLGGMWLSSGCIPANVYLRSESGAASLQSALMQKNNLVSQLTSDSARQLRSQRVRLEAGEALMRSAHEIICRGRVYNASKVIICTGSKTDFPHVRGLSHPSVLTVEGLFKVSQAPPRLMVLGSGSDACELASVFAAFGSNVMLVDGHSRLLADWDSEIGETLGSALEKAGVKVHTGVSVNEVLDKDGSPYVVTERGGVLCDKVLVATDRKPDISILGPLVGDMQINDGVIAVNEYMETSVPGIYAAGSVTGAVYQTHTAIRMAEVAATNAMGGKKELGLWAVPKIAATKPEAASVGLTEGEAREKYGQDLVVGRCPFSANTRAMLSNDTDGFVKVLVGRQHGELYGVHIVGANAAELICGPAALMRMEVTAHEIAEDIIYAHPTFFEAFAEACAVALGQNTYELK